MRILITNDDGINAPGLAVLQKIAQTVAGEDGEVWTVAPAQEKSGVGHCINYTSPSLITELSPRRFAVEGNPADCVLAGVHEVLKDTPPDLILSGVNKGNNSAENTLYSGTLGAAIEGALQGILSIGLSQYYGPENIHLDNPFEGSEQHGAAVVNSILAADLGPNDAYRLFYNVNFPPVPAAAVKGTKLAPQGMRAGKGFRVDAQTAPNGRRILWAKGGDQRAASAPGTDAALNLDGYITVTPMTADLTDHAALDLLRENFQ